MKPSITPPVVLGLVLTLHAFGPWSAKADWIQTRDGARVETRGAWKVKGSSVIFTSKNGTLSSLRLSEVDLDASAVATVEANQPPAPTTPPPERQKRSVLVLTDKDIPRASPAGTPDTNEGDEAPDDSNSPTDGDQEENQTATNQATAEPVTVTQWTDTQLEDLDGLEVNGTLQNHAAKLVTDVRVLVRLRDQDGELLGVSNAFLGALSLAPGSTTKFRAVFPDVSATSIQPEFEIRSHGIDIQTTKPQQQEGNET